MSRAYRIRVRESVRKVITADDSVSTQLEVLEILPADQMAELLAQELQRRGFKRQPKKLGDGDLLVRESDGVTIEVDPATATVTIRSESERDLELEKESTGIGDQDWDAKSRASAEKRIREQIREDLDREAEAQRRKLQEEATTKLEGVLADLRKELDGAVNRITADALKQKARQMGEVKQISEDESGSLTIVVAL